MERLMEAVNMDSSARLRKRGKRNYQSGPKKHQMSAAQANRVWRRSIEELRRRKSKRGQRTRTRTRTRSRSRSRSPVIPKRARKPLGAASLLKRRMARAQAFPGRR